MSYLKYTPYLYLILGIYLIIDSIINWNNPAENAELTLIFAAIVIFLFGFRRRYAKRFEERKNNRNQQ
jgi:surface polysaccharide O-acyltransferase-like enzyme